MSSPRVLIVDLSRWYGGSNARVLGLMQALPEGMCTLAVLRGSEVQSEAAKRGLPVVEVGRHKLDVGIYFRLRALIREGGYTVLDAQNPQSKAWSSLGALRSECALVSTLNSWYRQEYRGRLRGRAYQSLESWTTRRTDGFIVVADEIGRHLRDVGVEEARIHLIANAVDVASITERAIGGALRAELGVAAEVPLLVAVGRLVWAKGYAHLLRAMATLRDRPWHLVIVGEGRDREGLDAEIGALSLGDRVTLLGYREHEEALKVLAEADIFVMPSLSEGTPISLLEAGALARPMIASRVGGIPALVADGEQALLVEPGDETALAAAVVRLLDDDQEASRLGAAAQAHVREHFSAREQARQTLAAYEAAMRQARQRLSRVEV